MIKYITFFFIFLWAIKLAALNLSKEYYNWHFGQFAAITFNTSDLEPISYEQSRLVTMEGTASISDTNGNLLFYTEGVSVWNRHNELMPNGTGLKGHESSTQSALILRRPGSTNLYYIFTVGKGPYQNFTLQDFCYSVVDMNEDAGEGDVIIKNVKLNQSDVVEKLIAVMHANNRDYWVIAHELNTDNFIVLLLTENGVESINRQRIGPVYEARGMNGALVTLGELKANVRGDRLAAVCYKSFDLDLFHFDRATGVISNYLPVSIDNSEGTYGVEFSPSGQFVYTTNQRHRLLQFDISNYNRLAIEQSRQVIYDNFPTSPLLGSLQLAPNGKIYITIENARELSVINNPDIAGIACDLQFHTVPLIQGFCRRGLPNFCVTEMLSLDKLVLNGANVCEDEDIEIEAIVYPSSLDYSYKWSGPNGFTSNLPQIKIEKAKPINSGYYTVEIYQLGDLKMKDSIFIKVYPFSKAKIVGQETLCPPESVNLKVENIVSDIEYIWSDGTKGTETWIQQPGRYYVIGINQGGCADTTYFDVELSNDLDVRIMGPGGLCRGDSITLTGNKNGLLDFKKYYYLWSTGDTTRSIVVSEPGIYHLEILREGGCIGYDTVEVSEYPHPEIKLTHFGTVQICDGQSVRISVTNLSMDNIYTWEDGIIGSGRSINTPGIYKIYAVNQYSCVDSAEIEVVFGGKPYIDIQFSGDLNFCKGDSVTVIVDFDTDNNNIEWSDGNSDATRTFYESGSYSCIVSNGKGCVDTAGFEIKVFDIEKPEIIADNIYVCQKGTTVNLTANQEYHEYLWSNGATTQGTIIDKHGIYKLFVYNEIGCMDSAEIEIFIMPIEKPEIIASKYFVCDNDTITLTALGDYASYLWSDGSTNQSTIVRGAGTFKIYVTNELGCIDSADVSIADILVDISFSESNYRSEIICVGNKSHIRTTLSNRTEAESVINEIILGNNDNFKLLSPEIPFIIGAYESVDIVLEASSDLTGTYETSILAISNHPCYHETMSSAVQSFDLQNEIRLPQITAEAGQSLCIPIYGKIDCGASPYRTSATIEIHFNAEFFNPQYLASGLPFTKVIENGICKITIDYADLELFDTEILIDELCGVALIGNSETTDLVLKEVDWHNTFISSESENGTLTLEACVIELRPIQYFKPTAMTVSPLPANENLQVTINSGSIGTFELILVGFDGSQEILRTWENTQTSSVDLLFDISSKSQGVYSLLLKAPWSIHYKQILIVR